MRYALNVAPVNGFETHLAFGTALSVMTGAGDGHLVMHTAGQAAQMALDAYGSDKTARFGAGLASLSLSALGIGHAVIHGDGTAQADLIANGDAEVIPFMGGRAVLILSATGNGVVAWRGSSAARMAIAANDNSPNSVAARGDGLAAMVLISQAGLPTPFVPPSTFAPTHSSRVISTEGDNRIIRGGLDG